MPAPLPTAPRPKPKPRKPRRRYVVEDHAPQDTETGDALALAWLAEVAPPPRSL